MSVSISEAALNFLLSVILGLALGAFYDVFRILRLAIKTNSVIIFIQDLLYWSIVSVVTFFFMVSVNGGEVRIFVVIGAFLGATIYYFTIGVIVYKAANFIINVIKKILKFLFTIIFVPIFKLLRLIYKIFTKYFNKFMLFFKNIIIFLKKLLKKEYSLLYNFSYQYLHTHFLRGRRKNGKNKIKKRIKKQRTVI